jgi:hypothetical protein
MREISLKIIIFAVFCIVLANFGSCIAEPVSIGKFLEDETVIDIIDRNQERVFITPDSDPGLREGNGRIFGLEPNKYYTVEEFDDKGAPVNIQYVSSSGLRSLYIREISKNIRDGTIIGLTNFYHYRVRSAIPFPGSSSPRRIYYYDQTTPPAGPFPNYNGRLQSDLISNGKVVLSAPKRTYYMVVVEEWIEDHKIAEISTSGSNTDVSGKPIALRGADTITEYVLHHPSTNNFHTLEVTILPPPTISITVSWDPLKDPGSAITFDQSNFQVTQDELLAMRDNGGEYKITIDTNSLPPGVNDNDIIWEYGSYSPQTGPTFQFNDDINLDYLIIGVHTVSVIITIEGIPYSRNITINVVL